jgi:arylformamidase
MGMNAPTAAIARPKGPIVWLDRDQQQLDDAYNQLVYAPNRDRRVANSAAARAWLGEPLRFAHGPMPIEP